MRSRCRCRGTITTPPAALTDIVRSFGVAADSAGSVAAAIDRIAARGAPGAVLIAGSLYLAGDTLRINEQIPT